MMSERRRLRPWREVALLMLIMMEVSWVTPWLLALTSKSGTIPRFVTFSVMVSIVLTSYLVVRLMTALNLKHILRRVVTLIFLGASILVGLQVLVYSKERLGIFEVVTRAIESMLDMQVIVPSEFIIILAILIGWWRGISLAQEHIDPSSVMGYFRLGIFMFLGFLFFNNLVTGESSGGFIYLFIFCGLIAMTTARISVLHTLRGGKQSLFDRRWFIAVTVVAGSVVVIAAGLAEVVGSHVDWMGTIVIGIFGVLALLIFALISPVLALMIFLLGMLDSDSQVVVQLAEMIENLQDMIQSLFQQISSMVNRPELLVILSRLIPYLKAFLLISILLVVVIGVLLWVAMRLWKDYQQKQLAGDEQSLLEGNDLWRMIQEYLRKQWENIMEGVVNVMDVRRRRRTRAALRIRQIYADLLDMGEELGCVRPEPKTPLEFMPSLALSIPAVDTELELITKAYLKVRYGQLPENHQEVESVEAAWRSVEKAGKEKLTERAYRKSPPVNN